MSAKQCHRLRELQRERDYQKAMPAWLERKPHPRPVYQLFPPEAERTEKNWLLGGANPWSAERT